jgi:hypothetical protein
VHFAGVKCASLCSKMHASIHDLLCLPQVSYPFVHESEFGAVAETLARALASVAPFTAALRTTSHFKHGKRSFTLWLQPDVSNGQLARIHVRGFVACCGGGQLKCRQSLVFVGVLLVCSMVCRSSR